MGYWEDVELEFQLAIFFDNLLISTEEDYINKKISRKKRNFLVREIRCARDATMLENDALLKNNSTLREISQSLLYAKDVFELQGR